MFKIAEKENRSNTILYVGNFFFPFGNAAGKRVYGNGKLLRELGYNVIFIGVCEEQHSSCELDLTRREFDGFTYYSFSYPKGGRAWLGYKKALRELVQFLQKSCILADLKFVIYYGSPRLSLFNMKLIRFCRRNGVKVLSDCVDWLSPNSTSIIYNLAKWLDNTYQKAYVNKKTDGIIAVSHFLADYYEGYGCPSVVLPPLSTFCHSTLKERSQDDRITITYAGMPFRKGAVVTNGDNLKDRIDKTISLLCEVKGHNDRFIFNIYGFTKEEYLQTIPNQQGFVEKLEPNVIFHGYKPSDTVIEAVSKSDFTILIRDVNRATTAGFPTKVSESISCGTPVITTRTSDLEEFIVEGINGFFLDVKDGDGAVAELLRIFKLDTDEILKMKMGCIIDNPFYYNKYTDRMSDFLTRLTCDWI